MDLDAIFSEMESRSTPDDSVLCVIDDNLRIVTVPSSGMVFGVEKDKDVNKIDFEMDRYYRNNDMSEFSARIYYQNAKGNKNYSTVTDLSFTEDKITFSWTVPAYALMYEGTIRFAVNFIKTSGSIVEKAFNTTIASANCLIGLYIDTQIPEKEFEDYLTHLKNEIKGYSDVQIAAIEDAKTEALTGIDDAEEEALSNIKQASPALPVITDSDFGKAVTVKLDTSGLELSGPYAPIEVAVRPTVSGNPAVAEDSIAWKLQGLKVYGKSTQDGAPSPENPVPIVSAGDMGKVDTFFYTQNLFSVKSALDGLETDKYSIEYSNDTNFTVRAKKQTTGNNVFIRVPINIPVGKTVSISGNLSGAYMFKLQNRKPDGTVSSAESNLNTNTRKPGLSIFAVCNPFGVGDVIVQEGQTVTFSEIMVNYGDSALPWEPYKSQALAISTPNGLPGIPVESGGNFTNADGQQLVCDVVEFDSKKIKLRCSITGIQNFYRDSLAAGTSGSRFSIKLTNLKTEKYCPVLCNYFPFSKSPGYNIAGNYITTNESDTTKVSIRITEELSISEFKEKFSDLKIVYQLENPIETDIPDEELAAYRALTTYDGTTVVSTAEPVAGIEVSYVADTQKYIDKKIEEAISKLNAAQQGEETNVSL